MRLSRRQLEMLELAAHGLGSKQIATYLGLSRRTVEDHFGDMRERTGTKTRGELLVRAARAGLVQPEPDMFPDGRGTEPSPSQGGGTAGQALRRVPGSNQADSLSTRDVLGALRQLPGERGQLDHAERALIDIARRHGVTWAEIGRALGLGSAQAAQQRRKRLD